jgi:hypothetical protein
VIPRPPKPKDGCTRYILAYTIVLLLASSYYDLLNAFWNREQLKASKIRDCERYPLVSNRVITAFVIGRGHWYAGRREHIGYRPSALKDRDKLHMLILTKEAGTKRSTNLLISAFISFSSAPACK